MLLSSTLIPDAQSAEHRPLLTWLIASGLTVLLLFIAWNEGVLPLLYASDRSRISWVISVLFLAIFLHSALRAMQLSFLSSHSLAISRLLSRHPDQGITLEGECVRLDHGEPLPEGPLLFYVRDLLQAMRRGGAGQESTTVGLIEILETKLRGRLELGWFVAELMIKLGLLGTIVGFILMLASVSGVSDFDAATMRDVLQDMSTGMGTALYTTLAGLSGSVMLSVQYYLLDRYTDEVVEAVRYLAELRLRPSLNR